jgi:hypothetical protein
MTLLRFLRQFAAAAVNFFVAAAVLRSISTGQRSAFQLVP